MTFDLSGRVAVVTGASTGLGRGIATAFARHGAAVVVGDLLERAPPGSFDEAPELTTVALIEKIGARAVFRRCDVTLQSDMAALVAEAVGCFGRLDILVNNAGVYRAGGRMHELSADDLDACWGVIAKGSWFGAQEAVKRLLAQGGGGSIINIISTAGLRGHPGQTPYNMAKAAQANLTRCLALEYGADNIRSNAICPTYMKTAMSRDGLENEWFDRFVRRSVPLGRWGEIADVANLAVFLASEEGAFLNGALIPVDGGEVLGAPPLE